MRTILILFIFALFFQPMAQAENFVGAQQNGMYKAEKYSTNIELKDPKLIKLGGYDEKTISKYDEKIKKDELEYKKIEKFLKSKKTDDYNSQAYPEDFYMIYRIAERIIRANDLDYINWRIIIDKKNKIQTPETNLYSINLTTSLIDIFNGDEDALAFVVAHEIAQAILGFKEKLYQEFVLAERFDYYGNYRELYKKASLKADIEASKLIIKAGYSIEKVQDIISVYNGYTRELVSYYFPKKYAKKRHKNFEKNKRYFYVEEWQQQGKQNIVKSDVLKCQKSSNRKVLVILRGDKSRNVTLVSEKNVDVFKRKAYSSYLAKDMKQAEKYLKKWVKLDENNIVPYIYLSYIQEYLYKQTNKEKFLKNAHEYIDIAFAIDKNNKYVKEQKAQLPKLAENI